MWWCRSRVMFREGRGCWCCSVVVDLVAPVVLVLDISGFVFFAGGACGGAGSSRIRCRVAVEGCWAVRACVEDVCCRCARGAKRGGIAGADEMASSENSLPMAGAAKLRAVFLFARGGRLLSPPLTSYAAVAKSMG